MTECDFCHAPAHRGVCAELEAFVTRMQSSILPHTCSECGDPMAHPGICAACQEDQAIDGRIVQDEKELIHVS